MKRLIILAFTSLIGATSFTANAGRDESQIMASHRQHEAVVAERAAKQNAQRPIDEQARIVIVGRDRVPLRQSL
ncbi:MAG: hypothetical protein ACKVQU_11540 [Burkholderiales bacterium]